MRRCKGFIAPWSLGLVALYGVCGYPCQTTPGVTIREGDGDGADALALADILLI